MARKANIVSVQSGCKKPDFTKLKQSNTNFKSLFESAMYYAHYELGLKRLKSETAKYAKAKKLDFESLDILDNYEFGVIGKPCYILNNKGEIAPNWQKFVTDHLKMLIALGKRKQAEKDLEKTNKEDAPVITIQDRLKEQASHVASEFDGWVDDFIIDPKKFKPENYDPLSAMRMANLKAGHVRYIIRMYENDAKEIKEAIAGTCEQINETYACYTKPHLKKILKFYEQIETACNMIIESTQSVRAPRKKKETDIVKIVAKLKHCKQDKELGLVSINPIDVIGAKELWVYNTKSRKLGKYVALDDDGLGVKNATILNFSETESVEKTLRKPKTQLNDFKQSGKVSLRKFMENIATLDTKMKSRLNENHILLKVIR